MGVRGGSGCLELSSSGIRGISITPAPCGVSTPAWWRWIGDLELYYNPEFCEVCPRQRGVTAGQIFKFGGLYLRPPGDHRLWGGGVA